MAEDKRKSLVIVESPAKAKTINKYLGNDYIVTSSVGHIRELRHPEEGNKSEKGRPKVDSLVKSLGVDPYHGWQAWFGIIPGKEKVVKELKFLAKGCKHIYLATDLDREGEAIAWHLKDELGYDDTMYSRVTFNEITKEAIQKAFSQPTQLNQHMVEAQKTRQFLDKTTGYMVSPVLWKKVARGLSAGRVQSVAVRLVVEREDEISQFIPEEYYDVVADVANQFSGAFSVKLDKQHGKKVDFDYQKSLVDETQRHQLDNVMKSHPWVVLDNQSKPTTSKPSPPFVTSTLQQSASTRLGYGVKKTMQHAQKLYEAGYITYMRTDSTNISIEALNNVRGFIQSEYGDKYLPEKPNFYASKESAQEAHECIRPSNLSLKPEDLNNQEEGAVKLYDLIRRRFIASQMTPAQYLSTTIQVGIADYEFRAKGRVIQFDGFTKIMKSKPTEEDQELPEVKVGETLVYKGSQFNRKYTQPPARYNEASLVKELEKRGIGRPSTYATIISTIQDRGYVRIDKKRFYAEKIGIIVTDRLMKSFPQLMTYEWTEDIESKLDAIAAGKFNYLTVLDTFFKELEGNVNQASKPAEEGGMLPRMPILTPIKCTSCLRQMAIRYNGQSEPFLGCVGYTDKDNQCKHVMSIRSLKPVLDDEQQEVSYLRDNPRCPHCGHLTEDHLIDTSRKLRLCTNSARCNHFEIIEGTFLYQEEPSGPTCVCDKCGNFMVKKTGKFGKYMSCTCGNNRGILADGSIAPPKAPAIPYPELPCKKKGSYFVLREGKRGLFFAAHNFPKVREIRTPQVFELSLYKERLPEKFHFILSAPDRDEEGNLSEVTFHEKIGWYVRVFDKQTQKYKRLATYTDGKWVK